MAHISKIVPRLRVDLKLLNTSSECQKLITSDFGCSVDFLCAFESGKTKINRSDIKTNLQVLYK